MSILNMVKNIKEVHPKAVVLYRVGTFYSTFGKDSYIISKFIEKLRRIEDIINED